MLKARITAVAVLGAVCLLAPVLEASAQQVTNPVARTEVKAGRGKTVALPPSFDPAHKVDGRFRDWRGRPSGYGGTTIYSSGELVYGDHIFDAYGADDGDDVQRLAVEDPITKLFPETYRVDGALQYLPGEFGIPTPGQNLATHYGDLPHQDEADLSEFRVTSEGSRLWLLARTTTMSKSARTAVLVLVDSRPGSASRNVPFSSGIRSTRADHALLLTRSGSQVADLATGAVRTLDPGSVAFNPTGFENAIEARIPRSLLGASGSRFGVAAATGIADGTRLKELPLAPNLANVAFREREPVRDWWEKRQAFALHAGSIDEFFKTVSVPKLEAGTTERLVPGVGYWDRVFKSAERISRERGQEGTLQHYGLYLPSKYSSKRAMPLQFWFHFRGGTAHIAATLIPGVIHDMGETPQTIVVTPKGRGTSRWYVGISQVDFREVWGDVHRRFKIDRNRTYTAGHSMGGWASNLLPILYPDLWAASFPASAPVTQGAWTGVDFAGCDEFEADGMTPCWTSANGGDPRVQHTRPLLENLRHVPLVQFHGAADELVPITGVLRNTERLTELAYRWRLYAFPAQEHYGPPIQDQWGEGVRYEHRFVRNPNPARVTYIRSMPFERATERIQSEGVKLDFDFNRAYWMSGLEPFDGAKGVARFDGRSLAIRQLPYRAVPEAGGPAATDNTGPYAMTGGAWQRTGEAAAATRNAFKATLSGAKAVRLDAPRMRLGLATRLTGDVTTQRTLRLELEGSWPADLVGRIDGRRTQVTRSGRTVIALTVPAGSHTIVLERVAGASQQGDGDEGAGADGDGGSSNGSGGASGDAASGTTGGSRGRLPFTGLGIAAMSLLALGLVALGASLRRSAAGR